MSKNRILVINILGVTASIGVGIALAFLKITNTEWAIAYSFLSSILIFFFTLTLEIRAWPKKIRRFRKIAVKAHEKSQIHPVLGLVFEEITNNLGIDWRRISDGTFFDDRASIPELSISTIKDLEISAFATYIDDSREAFYIDPAGKRYLQAWYEKAKSLSEGAMCRVFILQDIDSCCYDTLNLIEEHLDNGVSARVISLDSVVAIRSGCEIDFGIFDETCLMTVAGTSEKMPVRLSVFIDHPNFANSNTVLQYKRFRERLLENSLDYQGFMKRFSEPINRDFWNYWLMEKETTLNPPHGVSKNDANVMLNEALTIMEASDKTLRIGILGLTPILLEVCNNCDRISEIVLIDQSDVFLQNEGQKVSRIKANWLTVETNNSFDIILGDESLNNIRSGQYSAFFKNLYKLLNPGGCVFLRCMGRFDQSYKSGKTGRRELIEELRKTKLSSQPLSISKVIKFLHSEELGFDHDRIEIDSCRYNQIIDELIKEGSIKKEEGDPWFFPCSGSKSILLTSPDMDKIRCEAHPFFSLLPLIDVDESYCSEEPEISHFYKIIGFVKSKGIGQPAT